MTMPKKTSTVEAEAKPLTRIQQHIHETIYKPQLKQAIARVESNCQATGEEFTLAAVCKAFAEGIEEEVSANRFRNILDNCGFICSRVTLIRELPTIA